MYEEAGGPCRSPCANLLAVGGSRGWLAGDIALDQGGEVAPEAGGAEALGVGPYQGGVEALEVEVAQRLGKSSSVLGRDQGARLALDHGLHGAAPGDGDDRTPGRLRLDGGDAELLDVGDDQGEAARIEVHQLGVADAAEELDAGASVEALQARPVRPLADDLDRAACHSRRLQRHLHPLVGDDLPDEEEVVLRGADAEALDRDRGMDDLRLSAVEAGDPLLGDAAVGDVAVDPICRLPVPGADSPQGPLQERPGRARALGQRPFLLEPGVAEGTVAIADVKGAGAGPDTLGEGAAARDHEVVAADVEPLGGA